MRPSPSLRREVLRFAFADARAHIADPEFSQVPVERLLSKVRSILCSLSGCVSGLLKALLE